MYRFIFVFIVYVQVYFCVHFYVQVDSCTPCLWTGFSLFSLFMYKFMYRFIPLLIVYVQVDSFTHCLCTGLSMNLLLMILELIVYVQVDSCTYCYKLNNLFIVYTQNDFRVYCLRTGWSLYSFFMLCTGRFLSQKEYRLTKLSSFLFGVYTFVYILI